ncbi:cbb3-type cytochrome c oxidase subunit 3 [Ectothiorhodospiraceae bacterium 2226]|nr:cbb3-type cytochrome c oxidase subunit 3 [Ectothiorhodospiraceae bacterium 2226]
MFDWLMWFTRLDNSKMFALVLFFVTFVVILLYVFSGKKRGQRLESYKYIPFEDDEDRVPGRHHKGPKHERNE